MYIHLQSLRFVAVFFSVGSHHINILMHYLQVLFLCINVHAHNFEHKYGLNYFLLFPSHGLCLFPLSLIFLFKLDKGFSPERKKSLLLLSFLPLYYFRDSTSNF